MSVGIFWSGWKRGGDLRLPVKRPGRPKGRRTSSAQTDRGERRGEIAGALQEVVPVELQWVREAEGHAWWRELLTRYHSLGYATALGAQLVYLIRSREGEVLGGLTYTSPAWRRRAREVWIGWDKAARRPPWSCSAQAEHPVANAIRLKSR